MSNDDRPPRNKRERITEIQALLARDVFPIDLDELAERIVDDEARRIAAAAAATGGD